MARVHLVVGPPGADLAGRVAEAHRAAAGAFGAALFLLPTRRHADRFRLLDGGAVLAPQVFDLQAFADAVVRANDPTVRPLADADRRLLLDSVLAELREANELPYFAGVADTRGFADGVAGYVAELKKAGVDLRQLLKASGDRKTPELNRHAQATRVFDRYQRRLAKLHRLDPDDRLGRAAELWASGKRGPFGRVKAVFVAGFADLTPYQQKLLDALRYAADDFWIGLTDGEGEAFAGPHRLGAWATGAVGEVSLFNAEPDADEERVAFAGPAGLRYVAEKLFGARAPATGSARTVAGAPTPTDGLHLIEAPGELGEARLVARHIRTLLADGTPPERIVVTARRLDAVTVELFREVFDEYAIPHDAAGADALAAAPSVAFLLRAWRLPDEDWAFPQVAAVLRSTFFRPNWPEVVADPELPAKAEALLRMLGEPRGRDAYLAAVRLWEHTPPAALEDEQGEEPERQKKQRLAAACRPFLERFFKAYERLKPGAADVFAQRLRAFADDIGLSPDADLERFWGELERWAKTESVGRRPRERVARAVAAITASACRGRSPRGTGVLLIPADRAAGLDCDYLFLTNLGEGSWPNLNGPVSLLDDPERERLRRLGFKLPDPNGRLGAEQLLFLELVCGPRRGTVLSYAAVDDHGQRLLPSSLLRELLALFPAGAIPTTHRRMPLDGYFADEPLSDAELRVQHARRLANPERERRGEGTDPVAHAPGSPDLRDNLARAALLARSRFESPDFGPYDGELRHPVVTAALAERFGPAKVFSPTALEAYVSCPFRFWLEHVLRLDPLEDPAERVEHTRRGAAFHRALARFHRWVQEHITLGSGELPEGVSEHLLKQIGGATEEYASRAPSAAGRELWRLEGQRLMRSAARYRDHWHGFRKPWGEKAATPTPFAFEADFGVAGENAADPLVITVGGVEVRVGGRIDRIDTAELDGETGFWVIDYKTGRATNYSAAQVEKFEKLQLPLYALAVERVLFKGRPARPLGVAYWLVTDTGPKPMLPSGKKNALSWFADATKWERFRAQLEGWVATLAGRIRGGDFPLAPRSEHCTDTCGFGPVCRISQSRHTGKTFALSLPVIKAESAAD